MPLTGHDPYSARQTKNVGYFNPHAPYGARPAPGSGRAVHNHISIHMPLTGHDQLAPVAQPAPVAISIHMPLTGHDPLAYASCAPVGYFNPHAPYGARPRQFRRTADARHFNPHAPYGARHNACCMWATNLTFQSTCPLRGTTYDLMERLATAGSISIHMPLTGHDNDLKAVDTAIRISIHMPLTGHDAASRWSSPMQINFNPHAPYGARLQKGTKITVHFCENRLDLRFSTGSAACQEQNRS